MPIVKTICLSILLCITVSLNANALPAEWKSSVKQEYLRILAFHPIYRMDIKIKPDDPLSAGVDCSRLHYLVYKRAGVLGIKRVTSWDIAHGLGGWRGINVKSEDAEELDIPFFTFKPKRPFGHTGVFMVGGKSGLLELLHASSFHGKTVLVPFDKKLQKALVRVRRITIGDKIDRNQNTGSVPGTTSSEKQKNLHLSLGSRLFAGLGLFKAGPR